MTSARGTPEKEPSEAMGFLGASHLVVYPQRFSFGLSTRAQGPAGGERGVMHLDCFEGRASLLNTPSLFPSELAPLVELF